MAHFEHGLYTCLTVQVLEVFHLSHLLHSLHVPHPSFRIARSLPAVLKMLVGRPALSQQQTAAGLKVPRADL